MPLSLLRTRNMKEISSEVDFDEFTTRLRSELQCTVLLISSQL